MKRKTLAALLLLPGLALGQAKGPVTSRQMGPLTPARYVLAQTPGTLTAVASGAAGSVYVPWPGRLVDLIVYQSSAGTGGTSFTVDVKTGGGTSLLTTLPVVTLASGADKLVDARGDLVLPSGWTRPVLKTDATVLATKGQKLFIHTTETGTYSPHPTVMVILVFEPLN